MGSSASTVLRPSPTKTPSALPERVVIYDGVCNLCDHTVKFLIKRDPGKLFRFCALQSEAAKPFLEAFGLDQEEALKSIVFLDRDSEGPVAYRKSAAAMAIASYLPVPWNLLVAGKVVPGFLRDGVYDCVASNRYKIWGKHDEENEVCLRPTPDILSRFLDADEIKGAPKKKAPAALGAGTAAVSGAATTGNVSGDDGSASGLRKR
jgi:predicted DCC family thiol-disulfide oxidoreductase YuxK